MIDFNYTQPFQEYDPYRELAMAVIKQAAADYRVLGKKLSKTEDAVKKHHLEEEMKSISRFFLSNWYKVLNKDENGASILRQLDEEVFGVD